MVEANLDSSCINNQQSNLSEVNRFAGKSRMGVEAPVGVTITRTTFATVTLDLSI